VNRRRLSSCLAVAAGLIVAPLAGYAAIGSSSSASSPTAAASGAAQPGAALARLTGELAGKAPDGRLVALVHAGDVGAAEDAVRGVGLPTIDRFERVGVAVTVGTPAQLEAAAARPGVTRVELDRPLDLALDTSNKATRGDEALHGFSVTTTSNVTQGPGRGGRGHPRTQTVTTTETSAPVDGSGVSIAIIDSGVDGTHPFFKDADGNSKVVRNLKFACPLGVLITLEGPCTGDTGDAIDELFVDVPTNDSDTGSLGGHGTHVSGIAGGGYGTMSDGRALHGAAPGAKLVGLSVGATLSVYGGAAGMNWVLEHHAAPCGDGVDPKACPPIKVINNSWGAGGSPYDATDVEAQLQDQLVAEGVTVVWAAGNDGGDGTTLEIYGPAQSPTPGVLSVANYDDEDSGTRDGALDSSSSRGLESDPTTWPDLAAPGATIDSSCRPYLPVCYGNASTGDGNQLFYTLGGTSMAAPHIAGIVAQLLQADPTLTPAQIEDVLEDTAHKFVAGAPYAPDPRNPDSTSSYDKGHGLVDVVAAVSRIRGLSGTPAAAQKCTADSPVVVDPEGDAVGVLVTQTPLPNEPALDVLEARMAWDGSALTHTIRVLDLGEEPLATGSNGESFRTLVTIGGVQYSIDASRDTTGESYAVGAGLAGDSVAVTGSFDAAKDLITVVIPKDALTSIGGPTLADGTSLTGIQVLGRRSLAVLAPPADTADAQCPYTLGLGAVPPPPASDGGGTGTGTGTGTGEPPSGPVEGTVAPGGSFAWSGAARTDVTLGSNVFGVLDQSPVGVGDTGLTECDLTVSGSCEEHAVQLEVPAAGADVKITLTPTSPGAIDLDVLLVDAAGRVIAEAATDSAAETLTAHLAKAGTYTIRIRHFVAVEATYDGLLTLT
jgi:serine protease AprX